MRLSERENRIISFAELQADCSIKEIAKKIRCKEHSVRYSLDKLSQAGVIQRYPFINIYPLGFEEYGLFFSLSATGSTRSSFLRTLKQSPSVAWILETAGDYNFGLAICAKRASEVNSFLADLSERFGGIIVAKALAVRTGWSLFGRKYLLGGPRKDAVLSCGFMGKEVSLDSTDEGILAEIAHNPGASLRDIAGVLSLSPATVQHRLKQLRAHGILVGHVFEINAGEIEAHPYRLLLSGRRVSLTFRNAIYSFSASHSQIVAFIECVGSWDYELKVELQKAAELPLLIGELYEKFGSDLREIKTLSILGTPKLSFYPFTRVPRA